MTSEGPTPPILTSPQSNRTGVLTVAVGVLLGNLATLLVIFMFGVMFGLSFG